MPPHPWRCPSLSILFGGRDKTFFRLLRQQAETVHAGSQVLRTFLREIGDPAAVQVHGRAIRDQERKGDELERNIVERLNRAFLTPLDREDIYAIATKLEMVMDIIEGVANRAELYAVVALTPEVLTIADLLTEETTALVNVVSALESRKSVV